MFCERRTGLVDEVSAGKHSENCRDRGRKIREDAVLLHVRGVHPNQHADAEGLLWHVAEIDDPGMGSSESSGAVHLIPGEINEWDVG